MPHHNQRLYENILRFLHPAQVSAGGAVLLILWSISHSSDSPGSVDGVAGLPFRVRREALQVCFRTCKRYILSPKP